MEKFRQFDRELFDKQSSVIKFEIQSILTQALFGQVNRKKLLKKFMQLRLSLDVDDILDENSSNQFKEWFKNEVILPYRYRLPKLIIYLCDKLEI